MNTRFPYLVKRAEYLMAESKSLHQTVNTEAEIILGVLTAVEENSRVTQRSVAKDLGIALGLTNAYIKRCVKKGLIKVRQVPANRYAYYLTPQGFAEKTRLTAEYLSQGLQFFRLARQQISDIYEECVQRKIRQIALHGLTELTEIAVMCARDYDIKISFIVDGATSRTRYNEIPIVKNLADIEDVDAVLITDIGSAQAGFDMASTKFGTDQVLVPDLLNITRHPIQTLDQISEMDQ